jgi:FkbM family methyltransferase
MGKYYNFKKIFNFKIPVFLKKLLKKSHGKNNLDIQLEKYLNFSNGFFIELGAHDGITQSNTYYYEKKKNWRGILIEPTPKLFKICKKNRSSKNSFFSNACVGFDYKKKDVKLIYSNLKTTSVDLTSDLYRKKHLANPELNFFEKQSNFTSKAKTLNSILLQSNAPNIIDFFSLDVEGAEFEVLNGIDYNKFNFRYIIVETHQFDKLKKFLTNKKYKFVKKFNFNDYLFKF